MKRVVDRFGGPEVVKVVEDEDHTRPSCHRGHPTGHGYDTACCHG